MYEGPGVGLGTMFGAVVLWPILVVIWMVIGTTIATWALAEAKGLNVPLWIVFGILFGLIALIAAAGMPDQRSGVMRVPAPGPQPGQPYSP